MRFLVDRAMIPGGVVQCGRRRTDAGIDARFGLLPSCSKHQ
jgi:hypothetical protein